MTLWDRQSGRVETTVAEAGDEVAGRLMLGIGRGGRQGRGARHKGESEARRVKEESQASESVPCRFPPQVTQLPGFRQML